MWPKAFNQNFAEWCKNCVCSIKYWLYSIFCKYLYQSSYMKYLNNVAWIWFKCCGLGSVNCHFWLSVFGKVAKILLQNSNLTVESERWYIIWRFKSHLLFGYNRLIKYCKISIIRRTLLFMRIYWYKFCTQQELNY